MIRTSSTYPFLNDSITVSKFSTEDTASLINERIGLIRFVE